MHKIYLLLILFSFATLLQAQPTEDKILELVKVGVNHHDAKQYTKAIKQYKEALVLDKNSTLANYELAVTYSEIGSYKEALKHAKKVIKQNKEYMIPAYMVKGNVLDNQGKTKKSIKLFKKAIAETEGYFLLNYNLGINYFKLGELDLASAEMIKAIKQNPTHPSSHLYLALAQKRKNEPIKSLLPVYYFMLLEPTSERAKNAYGLLQANLGGDVSQDEFDEQQVNIVVNDSAENPYYSAELMLNLMAAARFSDKERELNDAQYFTLITKDIFTFLGQLEIKEKDFWSEFYIPFFDRLQKSEHFETFCQYILQSESDLATQWVAFHPDELDRFFDWLNKKG